MIDAVNVIDKVYAVKGRSMAVKPNIVVLFYAIANSEHLFQSQLRDEWLLPLSTINTISTECRNAGYITLESIPGKRRECYLRFTEKGRQFADMVFGGIHQAEEIALQATLEHYDSAFIEALEFYAKAFQQTLNAGANQDE